MKSGIGAILLNNDNNVLNEKILNIKNIQVYYWLGEEFDIEGLIYSTRNMKKIIVDDLIYEKFKASFDDRAITVSNIEKTHPFLLENQIKIKKANKVFKYSEKNKVLFVASNDTHAKMFSPLSENVHNSLFIAIDRNENADSALASLNKSFMTLPTRNKGRTVKSLLDKLLVRARGYSYYFHVKGVLKKIKEEEISVIVLGNDWGFEEKFLCKWSKRNNIKTICVQEGPLDFDEDKTKLKQADYVLLQGPIFSNYLHRKITIITGNPKLPVYKNKEYNEFPTVMVNANFTYGVFEDVRDQWINDVYSACNDNKIEYFISKHPRDRGSYTGYNIINSNTFNIDEQLSQSDILISRFSTVIYEAILRGIKVIYYNPHHEKGKPFTDDQTGAISIISNKEELTKHLKSIMTTSYKNKMEDFSFLHCGVQDGRVIERITKTIEAIRTNKI